MTQTITAQDVIKQNLRFSDTAANARPVQELCDLLGVDADNLTEVSIGDKLAKASGLTIVGESSDTHDNIEQPFHALFRELNEAREAHAFKIESGDDEELNTAQAYQLWRKAPGVFAVSWIDRNEFDNPGMYSETGTHYYFAEDAKALLKWMRANMAPSVTLDQIEDAEFQAEIIEVFVNGLDEDVYTESGNFGSGFWHNELCVDLEELAAGNLDEAFTVIANIHDTAGTSFRAYHGIDHYAKLPNGVTREAIQEFCDGLAARAEELTKGFAVEWSGSNQVATWYDEDGDQLSPGHHDFEGAYWHNQFESDVAELDTYEVYDLDYDENRSFVQDAVETWEQDQKTFKIESSDDVLIALNEIYGDNNGENQFINHAEAAASIWERIQEDREEEAE